MRIFLAAMFVMLFAGCDYKPYRSLPAQQVEDYAICKSGGMRAYLNGVSEVRCAPPEAEK